ncbi:Zinc finger matrin-type 2 [Paramuricea clavata]|uniref:Zinc finger matrin-type 2 n=1 Tax=Paramuricea clavata TaxID=317549 RepID=A0A6S7KEU2_PARCT|nr:Zinc finger matrin-type 2 [Paramuricea clavata]
MATKPEGKADNFRRTWDTDEYEKLAKERLENEDEEPAPKRSNVPIKRELLKPREHEVDLDSTLGKSVVITKSTPTSQQGGYFCNVCDCIVKDSINFLDHINGKKHQRNLGMSMRVERSSLDQVKKRFELNKRKQEEEKKKKDYDFEARMTELKEEEERQREKRKEARKQKKRKLEPEGDIDPEMAAMMGFSGFGGSKK